jgi:hypothetical protein
MTYTRTCPRPRRRAAESIRHRTVWRRWRAPPPRPTAASQRAPRRPLTTRHVCKRLGEPRARHVGTNASHRLGDQCGVGEAGLDRKRVHCVRLEFAPHRGRVGNDSVLGTRVHRHTRRGESTSDRGDVDHTPFALEQARKQRRVDANHAKQIDVVHRQHVLLHHRLGCAQHHVRDCAGGEATPAELTTPCNATPLSLMRFANKSTSL